MTADFHKSFDKQFIKLSSDKKERVMQAVEQFLDNPMQPSLRNHPLKGEWSHYRSITVANDLRLHFRVVSTEKVMFVAVGTHSQLYK